MKSEVALFCCCISIIFITQISCSDPKKDIASMYRQECSSCHLAPNIQDLPKHLWKDNVLPNMGARMGIKDSTYNPLNGHSFSEQEAIIQSGVYHVKPSISTKDWNLLKEYIISSAPDSVESGDLTAMGKELGGFEPQRVNIDSVDGTNITFLKYSKKKSAILMGDLRGNIRSYGVLDRKIKVIASIGETVTDYDELDKGALVTSVGILHPSEIVAGRIRQIKNDSVHYISEKLHRPVHALIHDFNDDGKYEIVVCEFGNLRGKLTLLAKRNSTDYSKHILLNQTGAIRSIAKDMNNDGKDDLVVLLSQGNEGITILYQGDNLEFRAEQVIRFSPIYGSSWFELVDYDSDGDMDIITVNGDNADLTYIPKPYHGMRIHINEGNNNYKEKYFYPMNGATRLVANDFDKDGDLDFGLLSSFPDYERSPRSSFLYLENLDAEKFKFQASTFDKASLGRWLLMDTGDVDADGDEDIFLSSFTYSFSPVPSELLKTWEESNRDILILENVLK